MDRTDKNIMIYNNVYCKKYLSNKLKKNKYIKNKTYKDYVYVDKLSINYYDKVY